MGIYEVLVEYNFSTAKYKWVPSQFSNIDFSMQWRIQGFHDWATNPKGGVDLAKISEN